MNCQVKDYCEWCCPINCRFLVMIGTQVMQQVLLLKCSTLRVCNYLVVRKSNSHFFLIPSETTKTSTYLPWSPPLTFFFRRLHHPRTTVWLWIWVREGCKLQPVQCCLWFNFCYMWTQRASDTPMGKQSKHLLPLAPLSRTTVRLGSEHHEAAPFFPQATAPTLCGVGFTISVIFSQNFRIFMIYGAERKK